MPTGKICLVHHRAAVHRHGLARHEIALRGHEEYGRANEVLRLLDAFDRSMSAAARRGASRARAAAAAADGKGNGLILLTNGGKMSAYGAGSRFGWLHEATGMPEAVEGLSAAQHGEPVSSEFIRDADPDWLFVIDRGAAIGREGEAAQATLDNPLVQGTKAGQAGQILYLDPAPLYLAGGGLRSMKVTLDEITQAFADADTPLKPFGISPSEWAWPSARTS